MAANDLLTLDEAKRAVHYDLTDDEDDDLLALYVTAVSTMLDDRAGPTVARTVTDSLDGGGCTITLSKRPVRSITSVTEYRNGTGTALTLMSVTSSSADSYRADPYDPDPTLYNGIIHRGTTGYYSSRFPVGYQNVVVVYSAGRVQSTTAVDAKFKRAAGICLENLWRDRQSSTAPLGEYDVPTMSFPTFALPRAVEGLLVKELGQHEPWGIA